MRRISAVIGVLILLGALTVPNIASAEKGGAMPFIGSCCLGPRIGLELNEGKPIETLEWLRLVPVINYVAWAIHGFQGFQAAGAMGGIASCCIGPRVGTELPERKIRTMEWLRLVPVVNIVSAAIVSIEAYGGKTMTEIEAKENLRK